MYDEVLKRHPLFLGLSSAELAYALELLCAVRRTFRRGDTVHRIGDPMKRFGLVLSGTIQVYMDDINGNHMIMANVSAGDTFGEALCILGLDAPVYIAATSDVEIIFFRTDRLKTRAPENRLDAEIFSRFTQMLARRTLCMNDRIPILSKSSLRGKLTAFFSQYMQKYGSRFTIPFDRADMAVYLGADRSALSRELGRMRREGIIRFSRNRFEVLKKME